jgi:hypothetical protein
MSRRDARRIALWRMPLLMGAASLAGLIIGLIGEGLLDLVAWVALGVPVAVIGWSLAFMRR